MDSRNEKFCSVCDEFTKWTLIHTTKKFVCRNTVVFWGLLECTKCWHRLVDIYCVEERK
jgi:hypothetical protein